MNIFDEGYRQNILDGYWQELCEAILPVPQVGSFGYNPENGYAYLLVSPAFIYNTMGVLAEEGFISRLFGTAPPGELHLL